MSSAPTTTASTASAPASTSSTTEKARDTNNTTPILLEEYKAIQSKHLNTPAAIRETLSTTTDHPLWQDLATFFERHPDEPLQAVLDAIHQEQQEGAVYTLPPKVAVVRLTPKRVQRVRDKIAPFAAHRSNYCDWMACRLDCRYQDFDKVKAVFLAALSPDTIVVWRFDYSGNDPDVKPDIMHMGYAYRPGALAVMEIQVVEPIAAWVFTSNSFNKHTGQTGRVTFKESKALYNVCKTAILKNEVPQVTEEVNVKDVVAYYKAQRAAKDDTTPLDLDALQELQTLINERFGFNDNDNNNPAPKKAKSEETTEN